MKAVVFSRKDEDRPWWQLWILQRKRRWRACRVSPTIFKVLSGRILYRAKPMYKALKSYRDVACAGFRLLAPILACRNTHIRVATRRKDGLLAEPAWIVL